MLVIGLYLPVAMVIGSAAFLVSEWLREPGVPSSDHVGLMGVMAGLLWPVLVVGVAQLALVIALHHRHARI